MRPAVLAKEEEDTLLLGLTDEHSASTLRVPNRLWDTGWDARRQQLQGFVIFLGNETNSQERGRPKRPVTFGGTLTFTARRGGTHGRVGVGRSDWGIVYE